MNRDEYTGEYAEYLQKKHSQWETPRELIEACVLQGAGAAVESLSRIVAGEVNEVYEILTEDDQELIIRISREEFTRFPLEKWAITQARSRGARAPEVLLVTEKKSGDVALSFCLEKKIRGASLRKQALHMNSTQQHEVLVKAGKFLSRIHEVETPYYGWDFVGSWEKFTDWLSCLEQMVSEEWFSEVAALQSENSDHLARVRALLAEYSDLFVMDKPRLLHGDFSSKHILVEGSEVTGFIDFEDARGGDPLYDLARWQFFEDNLPVSSLIAGYVHQEWIENYEIKLSLYQAILAASFMRYYHSESRDAEFIRSQKKLEASLLRFP